MKIKALGVAGKSRFRQLASVKSETPVNPNAEAILADVESQGPSFQMKLQKELSTHGYAQVSDIPPNKAPEFWMQVNMNRELSSTDVELSEYASFDEHQTLRMFEEAKVVRYNKGERVIVNLGNSWSNPEFYSGSVDFQKGTSSTYVALDTGERRSFLSNDSGVGIVGRMASPDINKDVIPRERMSELLDQNSAWYGKNFGSKGESPFHPMNKEEPAPVDPKQELDEDGKPVDGGELIDSDKPVDVQGPMGDKDSTDAPQDGDGEKEVRKTIDGEEEEPDTNSLENKDEEVEDAKEDLDEEGKEQDSAEKKLAEENEDVEDAKENLEEEKKEHEEEDTKIGSEDEKEDVKHAREGLEEEKQEQDEAEDNLKKENKDENDAKEDLEEKEGEANENKDPSDTNDSDDKPADPDADAVDPDGDDADKPKEGEESDEDPKPEGEEEEGKPEDKPDDVDGEKPADESKIPDSVEKPEGEDPKPEGEEGEEEAPDPDGPKEEDPNAIPEDPNAEEKPEGEKVKCKKCNAENELTDETNYCKNCGSKLPSFGDLAKDEDLEDGDPDKPSKVAFKKEESSVQVTMAELDERISEIATERTSILDALADEVNKMYDLRMYITSQDSDKLLSLKANLVELNQKATGRKARDVSSEQEDY